MTIAVAYWLRSVWALVIGQVVSVSVNVAVSYWLIPGRVRLAFDRDIARELLGYGKFVTGSSIVLYIATELDSAVIGKVMGTEELGYYTLAATLATFVTANLSKVASSIMMPAYSKLKTDLAGLQRAYLAAFSFVMLVAMPAATALMVLAEPILVVVFGEKWRPAAPALGVLAMFGLVRSLASFNGYLFEGIGKPKIAFYLATLRLMIIVPLIVPAVRASGLVGAAGTITLGIAVQAALGLWILRRAVEIRGSSIAKAVWRPIWTTALMAASVASVAMFVDTMKIPGLAASIGTGMLMYLALNAGFMNDLRRRAFSR